jgi:hypothetical protein
MTNEDRKKQLLNLNTIQQYAKVRVERYGADFEKAICGITLHDLAEVGFYDYKTAGSNTVGALVADLIKMHAHLIRDEFLSCFFQDIVTYVVEQVYDGEKSSVPGVDFEFRKKGVHYLVSVKPDLAWGSGRQRKKLVLDLFSASKTALNSDDVSRIEAMLGICYGRQHKFYVAPGCLVAIGQEFWYLVYENYDLYTNVVEPAYQELHEKMLSVQKGGLTNRLTFEFIGKFCNARGTIDWDRFSEFHSGYFDLDRFL